MLVSQNELINACAKAFKGLRKKYGEAEQIAEMVVNIEMLGLDGIKKYVTALKSLKKNKEQAPSIKREGRVIKVDLKNYCLIPYIYILINNALSFTDSNTTTSIEVSHSYDNWIVMGLFEQIANQKLFIRGFWKDPVHRETMLAIASPKKTIPAVHLIKASQTPRPSNASLIMDISSTRLALNKPRTIMKSYSSLILKKNRQKILDKGIRVSQEHWDFLNKQAKKILVPASQKSLSGAG